MGKPADKNEDQGYCLKHGKREFIAVPGDGVVCLTIYPVGLQDDDHRSISVMSVKDTETGKSAYEFSIPTYDDAEIDLWASAFKAATTMLAFLYGKESDETT